MRIQWQAKKSVSTQLQCTIRLPGRARRPSASGRGSPYGLAGLPPVLLRARRTSCKWTRLALRARLFTSSPPTRPTPPPRTVFPPRDPTTHMATPRAGSRTRSAWSGPGARTRGRFARRVDRSGRGEEFGARADATSPPLEPRRAPGEAPRAARGARARAARTSERFARRVDRTLDVLEPNQEFWASVCARCATGRADQREQCAKRARALQGGGTPPRTHPLPIVSAGVGQAFGRTENVRSPRARRRFRRGKR